MSEGIFRSRASFTGSLEDPAGAESACTAAGLQPPPPACFHVDTRVSFGYRSLLEVSWTLIRKYVRDDTRMWMGIMVPLVGAPFFDLRAGSSR